MKSTFLSLLISGLLVTGFISYAVPQQPQQPVQNGLPPMPGQPNANPGQPTTSPGTPMPSSSKPLMQQQDTTLLPKPAPMPKPKPPVPDTIHTNMH